MSLRVPKNTQNLSKLGGSWDHFWGLFSEEADIEKMTIVLHFHYILVIRGSKKEVPKTSEKQFLKKNTKKSEKVSLWGSIWEAVGRLFGIIFACQFLAEKRHPLGRPACGVKGLTGGLKTAT